MHEGQIEPSTVAYCTILLVYYQSGIGYCTELYYSVHSGHVLLPEGIKKQTDDSVRILLLTAAAVDELQGSVN